MPELPEVETIVSGLKKLIVGFQIEQVTHDWPKSFPNSKSDVDKFLIGASIVQVRRRAKVLIIDLNTNYSLVIHLKMTGQLVFRGEKNFGGGHPGDSLVDKLPDKSTRVIIKCTKTTPAKGLSQYMGENYIYFNDQRKFGWVRLLPTKQIEELDFFQRLGPEPLASNFSMQEVIKRINKRSNSKIKPVIIDQSVLAGVGNIYADEALWGAKIHPETRVKDISDEKLGYLIDEIIYVLKLSIEKGGSTDKNYVNAEGKRGSYLSFARVFRRDGLACPRCNEMISKIVVAGRGTHLCLICQKLK